jgi:hypothetical protein
VVTPDGALILINSLVLSTRAKHCSRVGSFIAVKSETTSSAKGGIRPWMDLGLQSTSSRETPPSSSRPPRPRLNPHRNVQDGEPSR